MAPPVESSWKRNPVLWLTWGLLVATVVASFVTLGLVLTHPDSELSEVADRNIMMR